jgi:hypothetical protein
LVLIDEPAPPPPAPAALAMYWTFAGLMVLFVAIAVAGY